jgi:hypothetical protein
VAPALSSLNFWYPTTILLDMSLRYQLPLRAPSPLPLLYKIQQAMGLMESQKWSICTMTR